MKEGENIEKMFRDLYSDGPWISVTLIETLNRIDAKMASARPLENCNTIWEILNHLILWRENVLKKVQGEIIQTPEHNYFIKIEVNSHKAWRETLKSLEKSQEKWVKFLKSIEKGELSKVYAPNNHTYYEHIHGILQHDAYHLGQIVLLLKAI